MRGVGGFVGALFLACSTCPVSGWLRGAALAARALTHRANGRDPLKDVNERAVR